MNRMIVYLSLQDCRCRSSWAGRYACTFTTLIHVGASHSSSLIRGSSTFPLSRCFWQVYFLCFISRCISQLTLRDMCYSMSVCPSVCVTHTHRRSVRTAVRQIVSTHGWWSLSHHVPNITSFTSIPVVSSFTVSTCSSYGCKGGCEVNTF